MTATVFSLRPQIPAALLACKVGAWEYDIGSDLCYLDAFTSSLFGVQPQDGAHGIPFGLARTRMHEGDQPIGRKPRPRARRDGSIFVHEFRALPAPGIERRVLARGRFETDAAGAAIYARGIAIDLGEGRADGFIDGRISDAEPRDRGEAMPIERATEAALTMYDEIRRMGPQARPSLLTIAELLLYELGRQTAGGSGQGAPGRPR